MLLTPVCQREHLFSVDCFIIVSYQSYHCCVVSELYDGVGAVCVVGVEGVQKCTETTALWGTGVEDQW